MRFLICWGLRMNSDDLKTFKNQQMNVLRKKLEKNPEEVIFLMRMQDVLRNNFFKVKQRDPNPDYLVGVADCFHLLSQEKVLDRARIKKIMREIQEQIERMKREKK